MVIRHPFRNLTLLIPSFSGHPGVYNLRPLVQCVLCQRVHEIMEISHSGFRDNQ